MILEVNVGIPDFNSLVSALIREGHLVEMVARALRVCIAEGSSRRGINYSASTRHATPSIANAQFRYTAVCIGFLNAFLPRALVLDAASAKNITRRVLRQGFRDCWHPTLQFLRDTRIRSTSVHDHDSALEKWQELGEKLGFDENLQKVEYERESRRNLRYCTWKDCRYYQAVSPVSLRSCKGCAEAVSVLGAM